jgi:L-arabinonolactonase
MVRNARYSLLSHIERDRLGEAPWWSTHDQALVWVDILGRKVHCAGLDGADLREWTTPADVSFALRSRDGAFLLGLRSGLHRLDPQAGVLTLVSAVGSDSRSHRLNDGKTDRRGRVWFGTMHDEETAASASLYRFDTDGLTEMLGGITTSNGLGWNPEGTLMYHTDSMTRTIRAYRFDVDSGRIYDGRVFARDPEGYVPDGLTVDTDGCVWGAKWNGSRIVRYRPDGAVDIELTLPVARPTSCMFVGSDLRTLAVTSASPLREGDLSADLDGSVFLIETGAQGLPEEPAIALVGGA